MSDPSPPNREREVLTFENDKGASRSKWIAGAILVAVVVWMGSGFVFPATQPEVSTKTPATQRAVAVAVRRSVAEPVEQVFVAEGQAQPDRNTMIRAETSGTIKEIPVRKGDMVEAGQLIVRFDTSGPEADLQSAQQEFARAQREFDNATSLLERGVSTADRLAQARASLAAAKAGVSSAEDALDHTEIRAPFAGRLEALGINRGEFVASGAEVGRVVDNTPLTIRIQIPQQSLRDIKAGQDADVAFITGETAKGRVAFVGSSADTETRTFTAEIEVPNAGGAVPAGVSAQVRIPTGAALAHFVSPAILSLGSDGTLGIKTVEQGNKVAFHPIAIVRAQTDGIWINGLPDEAEIISIGQGFVSDGETVDPKPEGEAGVERAPGTEPAMVETPSEGKATIIEDDSAPKPDTKAATDAPNPAQ